MPAKKKAAVKKSKLVTEQKRPAFTAPSIGKVGGIAPGSPTRIWCTVSTKINTGNYESTGFDAGMSADLEEGETVREGLERICGEVESFVIQKIVEVRATLKPSDD